MTATLAKPRERELVFGDWKFPRQLTDHDVARLKELGYAMKCDDCSTDDHEVWHPITGPDAVKDLHHVNDLLKAPLN